MRARALKVALDFATTLIIQRVQRFFYPSLFITWGGAMRSVGRDWQYAEAITLPQKMKSIRCIAPNFKGWSAQMPHMMPLQYFQQL